jgi:hypothetical protein
LASLTVGNSEEEKPDNSPSTCKKLRTLVN